MSLRLEITWKPGQLVPSDRDALEEGIALWPLSPTTIVYGIVRQEAEADLSEEAAALSLADEHSRTADEFEHIASALESGYFDDPGPVPVAAWEELAAAHEESPFCAFEIGVSGLALVLAFLDCLPAASCRGHTPPQGWATYPILYFGSDDERAALVAECCAEVGCGFGVGENGLAQVVGRSVADTHRLAQDLLARSSDFSRLSAATCVPERPAEW